MDVDRLLSTPYMISYRLVVHCAALYSYVYRPILRWWPLLCSQIHWILAGIHQFERLSLSWSHALIRVRKKTNSLLHNRYFRVPHVGWLRGMKGVSCMLFRDFFFLEFENSKFLYVLFIYIVLPVRITIWHTISENETLEPEARYDIIKLQHVEEVF